MRFYFSDTTRPKQVAQLIKVIFPMHKLSGTQELVAKLYGYRDWHELVSITKEGKHAQSQFDDDLPEGKRLMRSIQQDELVMELMGVDLLTSSMVVNLRLGLTTKTPAPFPNKAEGVPSGDGILFNILKYEVLGTKKNTADYSDTPEIYSSVVVPEQYGTEKSVISKLLKKIRKVPHSGLDPEFYEYCEDALLCAIPEGVTWDYAEVEEDSGYFTLRQTAKTRIYIFDRENQQPRGFLVYELFANANRDDDMDNELEFKIIEAWAEEDDHEAWTQIIGICASTVTYTVSQLYTSFNTPRPDHNMHLSMMLSTEHRESHLLQADVLASIADLARCITGLDEDPFHIAYGL